MKDNVLAVIVRWVAVYLAVIGLMMLVDWGRIL